jgi:hypothetical protein
MGRRPTSDMPKNLGRPDALIEPTGLDNGRELV